MKKTVSSVVGKIPGSVWLTGPAGGVDVFSTVLLAISLHGQDSYIVNYTYSFLESGLNVYGKVSPEEVFRFILALVL